MNFDELMMHRCLQLASRATGFTNPNPLVGAVLVFDGKIIGEGYHKNFGSAHAEIEAIESVSPEFKKHIADSVLYVNLEPCNHTGKTPPCSDRIIREQIKKVMIGNTDPNPVAGGGIEKLRSLGIEVMENVLSDACREVNKFFFCFHEKKRPYIKLKWAQSADGFIAGENYEPIHFTNEFSDRLVHKWRSEYTAIFVGGKTLLNDDPLLTTRKWPGKNPVRMSYVNRNNLRTDLNIFNKFSPSIIFNNTTTEKIDNVDFVAIPESDPAEEIIQYCFGHNINSILVEGGTKTIRMFVDAGLWDEASVFISQSSTGSGVPAPAIPGNIVSSESIFNNLLLTTKPA